MTGTDDPGQGTPPGGFGTRLIKGAGLMIGMRWSIRLIGVVNVSILARLLTPEDFGVVGMAMVAVALFTTMQDIGVDVAVIRHPDPSRAFYDTAWTLQAMLGLAVGAIIALTAPLFAGYFNEPRLVPVLHVLALSPALTGLVNIGVADFRRHLDFGKDFRFHVVTRLFGVAVTLGLAFLFRNYWALVLGQVGHAALLAAMSYRVHPYRPRPSLAAFREIGAFSFWLFVRALAFFGTNNLHRLLGGRIAAAPLFGAFSVSAQVSRMLVAGLTMPVARAMVPGYARIQDDLPRLVAGFRKVAGMTLSLSLAAGFGMAAMAEEAVLVLLGEQWGEAVPLMRLLAIGYGFSTAAQPATAFLTAIGKARRAAFLELGSLAALLAALLWAAQSGDIAMIALAFAATLALISPLMLVLAVLEFRVSGALLADFGRTLVAVLAMYAAVTALPLSPEDGLIAAALAKIALGAIVYGAVLLALWYLTGRPASFEAEILERLSGRTLRKRA